MPTAGHLLCDVFLAANEGEQTRLWHKTKSLVLHLTILDEEQRRNRGNAVALGKGGKLVDVNLKDGQFRDLFGNLLHDGGEHVAGAAPGGKEVDEDFAFGEELIVLLDGFNVNDHKDYLQGNYIEKIKKMIAICTG